MNAAPTIVTLSARSAQDPAITGTKGATLARMLAAGVRVPRGFVITTAALEAATQSRLRVGRRLAGVDAANHRQIQRASDRIRAAIEGLPMPRGLAAEIRRAHKKLGAAAVSVRSSSTAEDLDEASFAGQYDSFLNVGTTADLLRRVRQVWASLYSAHAIGYRLRHRIPVEGCRMAVVVQRQLDPHAAGVLFTRDPLTGQRRFVVSAALGLGEGVVAGTAQTDRFVLSQRSGKLLSSDIASKKNRVALSAKGGIESVSVSGKQSERPALTTAVLRSLATAGRKLAESLGGPQDIEFAVTGRRVHILQSRPMTALQLATLPSEPWDAGLDRRRSWSRARGPIFRLQEDLTRLGFEQSRICFEQTGMGMVNRHLFHIANGYVYTAAPRVSMKEIERRHELQRRRVAVWERQGISYFEGVMRGRIEKRLATIEDKRRSANSLLDFVGYLEAAMQTCALVQSNLHWRQWAPPKPRRGRKRPPTGWQETFHELTGAPKLEAEVLTQGVQNRMTRLIARLLELARIAKGDRVLERLLQEGRFDDLERPSLRRRDSVKRFQQRFGQMLRVYGARAGHGFGSRTDSFTEPTWNMDPSRPLDLIASYTEQDLDRLESIEQEARAERLRMTRHYRAQLSDAPEELARFDEGLGKARRHVVFIEDHNHYMEQLTVGAMREAMHNVGSELARRDLVETPDDVFHLSLDELRQMAGSKNPADQRQLVQRRAKEHDRRKLLKPPERLGAKPKKVKRKKTDEDDRGRRGRTIKGVGASRGRGEGRAVVVANDRVRLHPGDILVAPNVGPDWTPAFAFIGGLVLDEGQLSQHAAIVAREYRVPAVMQTKEATKFIRSGQTIIVDGDRGVVELGDGTW